MRRELRFKNFDDIRQELISLEKGPVITTSNWSYFQILEHCREAVEGSMKGVHRKMSWWKMNVKGPLFYWKISRDGFLPTGLGSPLKGTPVEKIEGDEKAALEQLRKALDDFEKFEGIFSTHPYLGRLNKKQWVLFHTLHLANHLGHAELKEADKKS